MRNGQHKDNCCGIEILFEDEWLVVIDKPGGLLTMSTGRTGETTAYSILTDYMRSSTGNRKAGIYIVHRLDKDTSGILIFAKDEDTRDQLQENWENAVTERKYTAIVEGHINDDDGWIESWLYENPRSMKVHCYSMEQGDTPERPPRKGWQYASTHCKTSRHGCADGKAYTQVEVELETGRKNQIRTHLSWIGHPIAGDRKYGAVTNPIGRLALHAAAISFTHPRTGKSMRFTSPLPRKFRKLWKEKPSGSSAH